MSERLYEWKNKLFLLPAVPKACELVVSSNRCAPQNNTAFIPVWHLLKARAVVRSFWTAVASARVRSEDA